jgi:cytochrome c peroxidase
MHIVLSCLLLCLSISVQAADYALPIIGNATDLAVVTADNRSTSLYELGKRHTLLLSFMYTQCSDVNGCPLATQTLHKIARQLAKQTSPAPKIRLLSVSFNPQDTPSRMRDYAANFSAQFPYWQFATLKDQAAQQTMQAAYPQNLQQVFDTQGRFSGDYSHLLRVYLIDDQQHIRNIYSADFLDVAQILQDIQVVTQTTTTNTVQMPQQSLQAGDDREQYANAAFRTHSAALAQRHGSAADLMRYIKQTPLGLPRLPLPQDNPPSAAKIALGRKLFYDRRLSLNNTFSCAMCHIPEQGFSSNEMTTPVGVEGRSVRRNSPSLYNVGYQQLLFHDGRENSLEQQAWGPLLANNEMANPSIGFVIDKLKSLPDYRGRFETAFKQTPNMLNVGQALASYQRSLNSADAAFDRWYYGKQLQALSPSAQHGFALFTGKAGCSQCHSIGTHSALFSDQQRHNTGIGYRAAMLDNSALLNVQAAPGVQLQLERAALNAIAATPSNDLGYYEITLNPADRWRYKTPSLRNIALSAPYMHDGSLPTLRDVLNFYNQGGIVNENLDPLLKPLNLSNAELDDLEAFLNALTGSNVQQLIADGFAAVKQ